MLWSVLWVRYVSLTHLVPDYHFSNYNKSEGQTYQLCKNQKHSLVHWLDGIKQDLSLIAKPTHVFEREWSEGCGLPASVKLTGVEEDHGLQADVLLPLKLQLTKARGACQQHVENLHDAFHTLSLLPADTERERERGRRKQEASLEMKHPSLLSSSQWEQRPFLFYV